MRAGRHPPDRPRTRLTAHRAEPFVRHDPITTATRARRARQAAVVTSASSVLSIETEHITTIRTLGPATATADHSPVHPGLLIGEVRAGAPSWVVAAATLAGQRCSSQPAKASRTVDRRFNRRAYDAAKVIAAFGACLRDELDRDAVAADLFRAIDQAVQPTTKSFWLRSSPVGGTPSGPLQRWKSTTRGPPSP